MKRLNTYITEWKANTNTVSSIKKIQYFIHKLTTGGEIKIFDKDWPQFNDYKDKVYINGEKIDLNNYGQTIKKYKPGIYKVEIKDIDDIRNCRFMFCDCETLISVPFFDTMMVEDMYSMFKFCENLKTIPKFNTKNVKNMIQMFSDCHKLEDVPLFDTSKVKDMCEMFYGCENLISVPLFDTKNVESTLWMFKYCFNLKDVPLFDVRNIESMEKMFYDCGKLSEETIREWSQIYNFETHNKNNENIKHIH